jgi:transposase
MMTVEEWTTIRYLHAQGKSIRAIAQEMGIARNTVRAALRADGAPRYTRPPRPNPKLVPYAAAIEAMVFDQEFIGSRILRELRAQGYTGGATALYTYLRQLRSSRPDRRITERFETGPGEQGQFDWSPYTIPLGEQGTRVTVFSLTLGYSRRKLFWPSLDERAASIYEALQLGFAHFGGAPKTLLVDNAAALVTATGPATFNTHFLELCGHYGIKPVACQPGRPQTKGKVERPFFHLEQQLIKGNTWPDLAAFTDALARFSAELDTQVHGTTKERPIDRFVTEAPTLLPLPSHAFVGTYQALRLVSWDCLISFGGTRYSVPWQHAGNRVWVKARQGEVLIVTSQAGEEIAHHLIPQTAGVTVIDRAHYAGVRQGLPTTKRRVIEVFLDRFPDHGWFVEELCARHPAGGTAHLRAVLSLIELYPREAVLAAFTAARRYDAYTHTFLRGVLEQTATVASRTAVSPGGQWTHETTAASLTSDLSAYQQILEAAR